MKFSIAGESFHREDFSSPTLKRKNQAREHRLAVHKDSAGAALSQLTTVLRAGVPQILTQNFQQGLVGREGNINFLAVQRKADLRRFLRFNWKRRHFRSPRECAVQPRVFLCHSSYSLRRDGLAKSLHFGNSRAALSNKIFCFEASLIGRALNFSMFPLISGTPGPGQSVPHRTLSAISSSRGKYSISFCGGIPEISMYMFLWRRTRKSASVIQSGRPPCARMTTRFG